MAMIKADLHIHSNCSDGSDGVKALVQNIVGAGLQVFALTDHDTVEGCTEIIKYIPSGINLFQVSS